MHARCPSGEASQPQRLLSNEEYALLNAIRSQSQRNLDGVRTGRVSLEEIMGTHKFIDVQAFLENWRNQNRSGKRSLMPPRSLSPYMDQMAVRESFSASANFAEMEAKRMPMPNFSPQFYSIAGRYANMRSSFSTFGYPDGMPVNRNALAPGMKQNYLGTYGRGRSVDPNDSIPIMSRSQHPLLPPFAVSTSRLQDNVPSGKRENSKQFANYEGASPVRTNIGFDLRKPLEKKNYFSEYMSADVAARSVAKGQLYKGVLHVNQRSFEESFLVNANGDLQEDLLIFGLHDRNRALHGDVVIVRVKDRENWLVRDALFCAWREGHMKAHLDENGQPITVPPIRSSAEEEEILDSLNLPVIFDKKALLRRAKGSTVPLNRNYDREQMLLILIKSTVENARCFGLKFGTTMSGEVVQKLKELSIIKPSDISASVLEDTSSSRGSVHSATNLHLPQNRLLLHRRYYFLRDLPDEYWGMPNLCLQRTAEVVHISEHKNSRAAVGMLKVMADGNRKWALFSPNDSRMPRMMIPAEETPAGFFDHLHNFTKYIYVARMVNWPATAQFARGKLYKSLGLAGDVTAETEGLLLANAVDTRAFSASVLGSLLIIEKEKWTIDEKEFKYRKDFRDEFVFAVRTPMTRVIENAFHIKQIDDCDGAGTPGFEVGVHVADVAYFVQPGTELDQWASFRATSVNLVNKTIPMLPQILAEDICSLKLDADRLSLSVIWKMDENAIIHDQWFGRTIVRLHSEFSSDNFEKVEKENDETAETGNISDMPRLTEAVAQFDRLTKVIRRQRYEKGALHLEQAELCFQLDENSGLPSAINVRTHSKTSRFAEEILLLTNVAVAQEIEKSYGNLALLRRQCPPKVKVLNETLEKMRRIGIKLTNLSEEAITASLQDYEGDTDDRSNLIKVLSHFLMRPMQTPEYFCAGVVKNKKEFAHFALAVPLYSHFTSPLNRYADILVQRFLTAAVGYTPPLRLSSKEISNIAIHCDDKELIAKSVSEASEDMFFGLFVKKNGPLSERAVVVQILDSAFDILIVKYGIIKRVYANKLRIAREPRFIEGTSPTLTLYWDSHENTNASIEQVIQLCSVVDVLVSSQPDGVKYQTTIKQPSIGGKAPSLLSGF